jgi:hypothetical protein
MNELQAKVEDVIQILIASLDEAKEVEKTRLLLEERDIQLQKYKKSLDEKKSALEKEEQDVQKEKDYVARKNKEFELRELDLKENKQLIEDIKTLSSMLDKKKEDVNKDIERLDIRKGELKDLQKREEDINKQLNLLEIEKSLDRKRKADLDTQEEAILREQTRLQKVAETFKISKVV